MKWISALTNVQKIVEMSIPQTTILVDRPRTGIRTDLVPLRTMVAETEAVRRALPAMVSPVPLSRDDVVRRAAVARLLSLLHSDVPSGRHCEGSELEKALGTMRVGLRDQ